MTYPAVIFLALSLWAFVWPKDRVIYLLFAALPFGSLSVTPNGFLGGFNVLPAHLASVVFILRELADLKNLNTASRLIFSVNGCGLLFLFWAYALITSAFLPHMLDGAVTIVTVRSANVELLTPNIANFTQIATLSLSVLVTFAAAAAASRPDFGKHLVIGLVIGGGILFATGLADILLGSAQGPIFAPFKTAQYAYLDGSEVLGLRRVQGLMTEASSFGPPCVSFAAALLCISPIIANAWLRLSTQVLAWLLVGMAIMSTSSTAYGGVAVFLVLYLMSLLVRSVGKYTRRDRLLPLEFGLVGIAAMGAAAAFIWAADLYQVPAAFLDAIIFKKSGSSSFEERMRWNSISMDAFWGSHGLGVGVGATRCSNWAVAVLTNTGVIGALLLAAFLLVQWLKPAHPGAAAVTIVRASRITVIVSLVMGLLAGTSPDFGVFVAVFFGAIIAYTRPFGVRAYAEPTGYGLATARRA